MTKKKQKKGTLILDIGSAHVGAAVSHVENQAVVLEHTTHEPVGAGSKDTRNALEKQMLATLAELLKKYSGDEYTEVRIVLSAPWHDAHIRTIHSKNERPETISINGVEKIIERYKNEAPPKSGNVDVEAVAVQVRVNNYPTSLKEPVTGTHTTINLYESEMPQSLQRSLGSTVQKEIPGTRISFHTLPLISGTALRSMMLQTSFIYIDVGGEVSQLGVMHTDGIHFLGSIPIGYWTLVREMGGEKVGDTRSRLALWIKGELTVEEEAKISETFTKAFAPWLKEFEAMLKEASTLVPVPRSVFLTSDTEPASWFKKGIEDSGSMSLAPTLVTSTTVQRFVEIGEGGSFDVPLSLAAVFFHIGELTVVGEPTPGKMVYSK